MIADKATTAAQKIAPVAAAADNSSDLALWLDFSAKVLAATAWPIAAVALALIFATPIRNILQRITQFEGFGTKATFQDQVERLAQRTAETPPEPPVAEEPPAPEAPAAAADQDADGPQRPTAGQEPTIAPAAEDGATSYYGRRPRNIFAERDPWTIVATAWTDVDDDIRRLLLRVGARPGALMVNSPEHFLHQQGYISQSLAFNISELRRAARRAQDGAVTYTAALAYRSTADSIRDQLRQVTGNPFARANPFKPPSPDIPQEPSEKA